MRRQVLLKNMRGPFFPSGVPKQPEALKSLKPFTLTSMFCSPEGSFVFLQVSRSHTISLIFDMESQMVDAASPPACSLIGLSLPELFPDSGHEVFQTVWSSVAPYLMYRMGELSTLSCFCVWSNRV